LHHIGGLPGSLLHAWWHAWCAGGKLQTSIEIIVYHWGIITRPNKIKGWGWLGKLLIDPGCCCSNFHPYFRFYPFLSISSENMSADCIQHLRSPGSDSLRRRDLASGVASG